VRGLHLKLLLFVRFAVGIMTKHLAQLLYIVHCGVPRVTLTANNQHGRCGTNAYD